MRARNVTLLLLLASVTCSLFVLFYRAPSPALSAQSLHWQQPLPPANNSFFLLVGFNADVSAAPKLYGEQKWQHHLTAPDKPLLVSPSQWYFDPLCDVAFIECFALVEQQADALSEQLARNAIWLQRLETLLQADAPLAPLGRVRPRFQSTPTQLVDSLKLQGLQWVLNFEQTPLPQQKQLLQQFNHHLGQLIRQIQQSNIPAYQATLSDALHSRLDALVALLIRQPELKPLAAKELKIIAQPTPFKVALKPVLQREFARLNQLIATVKEQGISQALGWKLQVSPILQWQLLQPITTLNFVSQRYQQALALNQAKQGRLSLQQAMQPWFEPERLWQESNLLGALLVHSRFELISLLLQKHLQRDAQLAMVAAWLQAPAAQSLQLKPVSLWGERIDWRYRPLEQRLCLSLPAAVSVDEHCLRLVDAKRAAEHY